MRSQKKMFGNSLKNLHPRKMTRDLFPMPHFWRNSVPNQFKPVQFHEQMIAFALPPEVDEASPSVSGVNFTEKT